MRGERRRTRRRWTVDRRKEDKGEAREEERGEKKEEDRGQAKE